MINLPAGFTKRVLKSNQADSGQALMIILLLMAVSLTVGLAVVSRSLVDIRISQQEEESARAFSAAEAGIEQALIGGEGEYVVGDLSAQVSESPQGGQLAFAFPTQIEEGQVKTVWLVEHNGASGLPDPAVPNPFGGSSLNFYWGEPGTCATCGTTPALEVSVIYSQAGVFSNLRATFDPNNGRGNSFAGTGGPFDVDGETYQFGVEDFDLPAGTAYALRLKLIYNDDQPHHLAVGDFAPDGNHLLPSQGDCYRSCSVVVTSGITRCVQRCQFYKSPPSIFDYLMFSEGSLNKI